MTQDSLRSLSDQILRTRDARAKALLARDVAARWRAGSLSGGEPMSAPARPARPERPELRLPKDMPKRRARGGPASRIALLHALAHIELNAIDLAWDIIARFPRPERQWLDDWVTVGDEEAKHFLLVTNRLGSLGAAYGDLPAHDGLWQLAETTAGDVLDRLALVPMVMEARGLDVTPAMIAKFRAAGDEDSAAVLDVIYQDEIGHVAIGRDWFERLSRAAGLDPVTAWHERVRRHYRGVLKAPFNEAARRAAGLGPEFYAPLADGI